MSSTAKAKAKAAVGKDLPPEWRRGGRNVVPDLPEEHSEEEPLIKAMRGAQKRAMDSEQAKLLRDHLYDDMIELPQLNGPGVMRFLEGLRRMDWTMCKLPELPDEAKRNDMATWTEWSVRAARQCVLILDQWAAAVNKPVEEMRRFYEALDKVILKEAVFCHDGIVQGNTEHLPTYVDIVEADVAAMRILMSEVMEVETPNPLDAHGNPRGWGMLLFAMAEDLADEMVAEDEMTADALREFVVKPGVQAMDECDKAAAAAAAAAGLSSPTNSEMPVGPRHDEQQNGGNGRGRAKSPARAASGARANSKTRQRASPARTAAAGSGYATSAFNSTKTWMTEESWTTFAQKSIITLRSSVRGLASGDAWRQALADMVILPAGAGIELGSAGQDETVSRLLDAVSPTLANDTISRRDLFAKVRAVRTYYHHGITVQRFGEFVNAYLRFLDEQEGVRSARPAVRAEGRQGGNSNPTVSYRPVSAPESVEDLQHRSAWSMYKELSHNQSVQTDELEPRDREMAHACQESTRQRYLGELAHKSVALAAAAASSVGFAMLWKSAGQPKEMQDEKKTAKDIQVALKAIGAQDWQLRKETIEAQAREALALGGQLNAVRTQLIPGMDIEGVQGMLDRANGTARIDLEQNYSQLKSVVEEMSERNEYFKSLLAQPGVDTILQEAYKPLDDNIQTTKRLVAMVERNFFEFYRLMEPIQNVLARTRELQKVLGAIQSTMVGSVLRQSSIQVQQMLADAERSGLIASRLNSALSSTISQFTAAGVRTQTASQAVIDWVPLGPFRHVVNLGQPILETYLHTLSMLRWNQGAKIASRALRSIETLTVEEKDRRFLRVTVPSKVVIWWKEHADSPTRHLGATTQSLRLTKADEGSWATLEPMEALNRITSAVVAQVGEAWRAIEKMILARPEIDPSKIQFDIVIEETAVHELDLTAQVKKLHGLKQVFMSRLSTAMGPAGTSVATHITSADYSPGLGDWALSNNTAQRLLRATSMLFNGMTSTSELLLRLAGQQVLAETDPVMRALQRHMEILRKVDSVLGTHDGDSPFARSLTAYDMFIHDQIGQYGDKVRTRLRETFVGKSTMPQQYAAVLRYLEQNQPLARRGASIHQQRRWRRLIEYRGFWSGGVGAFLSDVLVCHSGLTAFITLGSFLSINSLYGEEVPLRAGILASALAVPVIPVGMFLYRELVRWAAHSGIQQGVDGYYTGIFEMLDSLRARSGGLWRSKVLGVMPLDLMMRDVANVLGPGSGWGLTTSLLALSAMIPGLEGHVIGGILLSLFASSVTTTLSSLSSIVIGPGAASTLAENIRRVAHNSRWATTTLFGLVLMVFRGGGSGDMATLGVVAQSTTALEVLGGFGLSWLFQSGVRARVASYLGTMALVRTVAIFMSALGHTASFYDYTRNTMRRLLRAQVFRVSLDEAIQDAQLPILGGGGEFAAAANESVETLVNHDLQADVTMEAMLGYLATGGGDALLRRTRMRELAVLVKSLPFTLLFTLFTYWWFIGRVF